LDIWAETTTEGSSTNTFNEGDELEKGTGTTYAYDELGERTKTTPEKGGATTYGYDQAGNMISAERPEKESIPKIADSYAYNGEGLRASQTISGTTTYMAWDLAEGLPLLLSDGTNSYIYGPEGLPIEQINNSTGTTLYLHHDQQGSTRLLTGSTGAKEASMTYDAYGNTTGTTGTATTPLGYDGQYTSSDTGLIYMRARTYDPTTGQFLSVDPLVSETRAPYNYAGDNPENYFDPTGLSCSLNPIASNNCFSEAPGAVISGVESVAQHPATAGGIILGGVALATGVGEVVVGGTAATEGTLGAISVTSGAVGTGVDAKECVAEGGVSCVGAGVSLVATGGAGAVVLGAATGEAASGATAISLTSGGIGFLSDVAGAFASPNAPSNPLASGCGSW
jgi:RHS repeat-associated protein